MCGILVVVQSDNAQSLRPRIVELTKRLRHRGPDWSGIWMKDEVVFAHERLSIIDIENGAQPLIEGDGTAALVVNGEIYNHRSLEKELKEEHNFKTKSDCEVLMYLWREEGDAFLNRVQGDFAFVVSDGKDFLASRDPIGVFPLYYAKGKDGKTMWFASEMKALIDDCEEIKIFPPGFFYTPEKGFVQYYNPIWYDKIPTGEPDLARIRKAFEVAVIRRMESDVPFGVLLSGGLDSSLVASVAQRYSKRHSADDKSVNWWPQLHSFCIGIDKNSPDQVMAKKVADHLGTIHHGFTFTIQDGLDAIESVIWHLESYDVTTVRASTPMYLLARRVKSLGVKMVLSGEGSDEIFGGYLYFYNAPTANDFHLENVQRIKNLNLSDCLRANKSTAAFGLEVRVPFLDRDFLDTAFSFDPQHKVITKERMEKWILRKAFDVEEDPYLPKDVLWRQKEQFSDGVGYSWIDELKRHAESLVSDSDFAKRDTLYPLNTPQTKEAFYFRRIFERLFPNKSASSTVMKWTPKWIDSPDPSGRVNSNHHARLTANGI